MQIKTVNVIEYTGGAVVSLRSFSDDTEGNKEAQALFEKIAKENGMDAADCVICLEEGLFEEGDYQVFLVHAKQ